MMQCYDWDRWAEQTKRRKRAQRWPVIREIIAAVLTAGLVIGTLWLVGGCTVNGVAIYLDGAQQPTTRPATTLPASQPDAMDTTPREQLDRLWRPDTWQR